jgi:GDP-L-fucose synthase
MSGGSSESIVFHPDTRKYFEGRRVIVTGGTGFIGSHAVEQLLELGAHPIVVTRRREPRWLSGLESRVEFRVADLCDPASTAAVIQDASVLLHMAASVAGLAYNRSHPVTIFEENMLIFLNTIRAARKAGVERVLVTSSACVYPRYCSIPTPESEGTLDEPEPTNAGYGWAKRMQEFLGRMMPAEYPVEVAIARPYNAYGPRDNFDPQTAHVLPSLIRKAFESTDGRFAVWGDGSHSRSFLYVEDFARGCIEVAARYACADPVNLGSEEEVTIAEAARTVAREVGSILGHELTPVFDDKGLTGQPRRACDTTKARAELGFHAQVGFAEGVRRTAAWYRENLVP